MQASELTAAHALVASLMPDGVVTALAAPEDWTGDLMEPERDCVAGSSEKRRREFTAGRVCARRALEQLGIRDFPLLPRSDRSPAWPPAVVGAISHSDKCCFTAVARADRIAALGVDVERADPLERRLAAYVCRESEIARTQRTHPSRAPALWKLIFSAKEATFKCYYPITRRWLDFHDVEIALDLEARSFEARIVRGDAPAPFGRRVLDGRFALADRYVFTGAWICAAA
ncbi:MAG TPA: 4'-phosphopantetheinyl transferase superfamily protein [Myxococcota bacterium]|nr:4'-phosphopantetheinyl transferase superfamily protein [Myxococcota bacterium]